jgi:NAD(P)-dependent dehydrogenase (short-subunit alcohol dehydrogenase family)
MMAEVPTFDPRGAVAVITGGASGIGLATARALRAQGAHVVLADVNAQGLQSAAEQVVAVESPEAEARVATVVVDVTHEVQVREMVRQALDLTGRLDLLVASAGVGWGGPIEEFPASEMQAMMNINFMGIYHCVQSVLPAMRSQHGGHIVLLSSVAGKLGAARLSGYCATKWAVRGFGYALRTELYGTGIGITTVYPEWVDTPMVHQETITVNMPDLKVKLTPDQVAGEILQAVRENRRDLTLTPSRGIATIVELTRTDPDQAEDLAGQAYFAQTHPGL